jgi:hypothetical protein
MNTHTANSSGVTHVRDHVLSHQIERVVEVPVTVERIVEVAVPYEKIVRIEVPVGKTWKNKSVIDLITKVEVQKIKFIFGRKIMCTCYVTTEMTLRTERIVYKDVPVPVQMNPERVVIKEVPQVRVSTTISNLNLSTAYASCVVYIWLVS